jgi:hypothetical protein
VALNTELIALGLLLLAILVLTLMSENIVVVYGLSPSGSVPHGVRFAVT